MDTLEILQDAAEVSNDEDFINAVAEVNDCYEELSREIFDRVGEKQDTEHIYKRLEKATAIVNQKLAERNAILKGEIELDDLSFSNETDRKLEELKEDFETTFSELSARNLSNNSVNNGLVETGTVLETAFGVENLNQVINKFVYLQ